MSIEIFHRPGQKTFGPWGNHTSSLDWCEDNYTHTSLIAEFYNTLSNIPFILLGVWGVLSTRGLPSRSRFALAQSFLCIIGVGSFTFHGTLLWHAQVMLDELPMIWSGAMCLYLVAVGGQESGSIPLKLGISSIPFAISWLYLRYPNPIIHQLAYAGLQVASFLQVRQLFRKLPRSSPSDKIKYEECQRNFYIGLATFLLGFAIWNIDNIFCNGLTDLRHGKGEFWKAITQGHAWWHILTGLGASRVISALTYLTLTVRRPNDYEFAYVLGHPYVKPASKASRKRVL